MLRSICNNELICIKLLIVSEVQVNAYYDYEEVIDSDEDLDLASMVTA